MGGGGGDGGAASQTTTMYASTMRYSLPTVSDHTRGKKQCVAHNTASRMEAAEGRWSRSCVLMGAEMGHRTGSVREKKKKAL